MQASDPIAVFRQWLSPSCMRRGRQSSPISIVGARRTNKAPSLERGRG